MNMASGKKSSILVSNKSAQNYVDALDERLIGRKFSDWRAFMAAPVSYYQLIHIPQYLKKIIQHTCTNLLLLSTYLIYLSSVDLKPITTPPDLTLDQNV
jgi:hypothetical protein